MTLHFQGQQYHFPPQLEPPLAAMCQRGTFRIRELAAGADLDMYLGFARYLQRIGFLQSRFAFETQPVLSATRAPRG